LNRQARQESKMLQYELQDLINSIWSILLLAISRAGQTIMVVGW